MKNKKGSVANILLIAAVGFAMALVCMIGYYVAHDQITPQLQDQIGHEPVVNETLNTYSDSLAATDYLGFGVIAGLVIFAVLGALLIRTNPAFFFLYLLVLIIAVVVAVPLSNAYQTMDASIGGSLTITTFVMSNLPAFIAVVGVATIVVSFVKFGTGGSRSL